ncbi:MAG: hypothetical protein ACLPXM_13865 [Terriglobales bacterium]
MRINHLAVALLIVVSSNKGRAQAPDIAKVNDLATAISHAEGFGIRGTIPNRYHNPGDLRTRPESAPLAGQVRIGKAGHIVFKDDEAGKAALRQCILQMLDGRSRHFHSDMTLNQVARVYAENWRPWVKAVSRELGVPPTTTLRAYFHTGAVLSAVSYRPAPAAKPTPPPPAPPVLLEVSVSYRPLPVASPAPAPPEVSFARPRGVLDAVLNIPVNVPPLVEQGAPQHGKLRSVTALLRRPR